VHACVGVCPNKLSSIFTEQQKNVKKIRGYPSPPSFALLNNFIDYQNKDQQLIIHRPPECVGSPVRFYHKVFNQFLDDYHNEELDIRKDHYKWTSEFIYEMARIYQSEPERQKIFNEKIRELFNEELANISLDDKSSNDGVLESIVHSRKVLRLLVEMKNEIGTGGCDPTAQAAVSFAKYYTQDKKEAMLKLCNCPCFIIGLAGPWICILGAVYVEKPIVEPLTHFIPLIPTNDPPHRELIARLFKALRLGVDRLDDFYKSLEVFEVSIVNSQRFFPYPNLYKQGVTTVKFTYDEKLKDQGKLLWKAETESGNKIILKFTCNYNQKAHELCSKIGRAPKLFYVSKEEVYGFYMVVMEYIEAVSLFECNSLRHEDYKTVLEDVEKTIKTLHKEKIVFADLRDTNILAVRSQEGQYHGMLVDFDWAGQEQSGCYPPFMNQEISWPPGAEDKQKLSWKHDEYWLNFWKSKYLKYGGQLISLVQHE